MASQLSNSGNIQDEAQEKLFSDNNVSSEPKIEIKFLDPKNGDTKIDISEVRQVFVGMGKDELMKFANDPFWVKMRWFLFILFWVMWVGMLAGAIAIILFAPKCDSLVMSQKQGNTFYRINVKNFKDSNHDGKGDIAGLESKLDYLKNMGVDTILMDSLMETAPGTDDVVNFTAVNPDFGTLSDLKKLVSSAKSKGLKLLMSIIPNFSSIKHKWFEYSVERTDPYTHYYIWTDQVTDEDGNRKPINNWLSVGGGSAWEWNENRKQYYLHQFSASQPDFNFTNPAVVNYFKTVFKFWLDTGLTGLHLDKVEYLIEDKEFTSESLDGSATGTFQNDYKFLSHTRTTYLSETLVVLSEWANVFKNYSAILSVSGIQDGVNFEKGDFIYRPIRVKKDLKARELYEALRSRLNKTSQTWGIVCDVNEQCNQNTLIGLQALLLMLPGTAVIESGLELGLPLSYVFQWDSSLKNQGFSELEPWKPFESIYTNRSVANEKSDPNSFYSIFQSIVNYRHSPSILYGATNIIVIDDSVLVLTRTKPGNPQYLIAFNLEESEKKLDLLKVLNENPTKVDLVTSSSNFDKKTFLDFKDIKLPGLSFIILQIVQEAK